MKGIWRRVLHFIGLTPEAPEPTAAIAAEIGPILDEAAMSVFALHQELLLDQPIAYVVPAVWGAAQEGPLTPEQRTIHSQLAPAIRKVHRALGLSRASDAQRFAVDYLVRGFLVSRITYAVEAARNRGIGMMPEEEDLAQMEPMGRA